jgi:ribonucleases P/MRP protein subunit RPP40
VEIGINASEAEVGISVVIREKDKDVMGNVDKIQVSYRRDLIKHKQVLNDELSCMYTNIRSIVNKNKREEIELLLEEKSVDIFGVTESWGNENIEDAELCFSGFNLFRQDRIKGVKERGGGVLLYVRDSIGAVREDRDKEDVSESIWIKVLDQRKREVYIGVCYRSPTANREEVDALCKNIAKYAKKKTLIMGDFNYRDIDWVDMDSGLEGREFIKLVNDCFLTQHVKEATRDANILDLVFTSEPNMVEEVLVRNPIANCDHNVLVWNFKCSTVVEQKELKEYSYVNGNYVKIGECLDKVDWEKEFKERSVNDMWNFFLKILVNLRDTYVPERKFGKRIFPMWMNNGIKKKIKKRNKAWDEFKTSPDYRKQDKYKDLRNKVTNMIKKAKINFEEGIAGKVKDDPKAFYSYVRSKGRTKVGIGPLLDENNILVDDTKVISDILNKYFVSVFTKENKENMPEVEDRKNGYQSEKDVKGIMEIDITQQKVSQAIKSLKPNKAAGGDSINSSFLLNLVENISRPLMILYNTSLRTGEVPEDWKKANITAIFKKGNKKMPCNYRPVSLTSHIGKIMEKIIKTELVDYLESNNLIADSQHGFRNQKSCLTNMLEFCENVAGIIDEGVPVDVVYLDFQKAFDKVPHERLLKKLKAHGIGGLILNWVKEWLRNRMQRVVTNGKSSEWVGVGSGVPQGSVLGPILFTIYINDLDDDLKSKILKFADDTKLTGRAGSKDQVENIKYDLRRLEEWSTVWEMPFNIEKCKIMHIGNSNMKERYEMGGKVLEEVQEEKDLGIIVSDNFKVGKQCLKAAKKGNQVLGMIARTFASRKTKIVIPLYKSLVRPHLDYCVQAWKPHLRKDIERLEMVQRRATRMVEECRGKDYEKRLELCRLTTLETRAHRADLLEVYKILHKMEKVKEGDFFTMDTGRGRGHSLKLYKKRVRLDAAKFSFGNRVCTEWNRLPDAIVTASSINVFKNRLDNYLGKTRGFK